MYFTDHTTPYEQRQGNIAYDTLMGRYVAAKADFLRDSPLGASVIEASLSVGETIYELEVEICPEHPECTGIFWKAYATLDREAMGAEVTFLGGERIPLDLRNVVDSLCRSFQLDREHVTETAVDLQAYWSEFDDDEHMKIPREEDKGPYLLSNFKN